eukprot:320552-Chlamydomonas_euryale.AAC.32
MACSGPRPEANPSISQFPLHIHDNRAPKAHAAAGPKLAHVFVTCYSRWEESRTWQADGKQIPRTGESVVLPKNSRVLITACSWPGGSATFNSIDIPSSSELIFDDTPLKLTVGAIWVAGKLSMGAAACRIQSSILITFSKQLGIGDSDLGLQVWPGGSLNMHGRYYSPTWTRLEATMVSGANWARVQEPVNWLPGQLVAITTSTFKDEYENQVEQVSSDGKTIIFRGDAKFPHYGGSEYQSELLLLSRNLVLQSTAAAESNRKGGHVRIMGNGRIQGVMAYRMGQRNIRGSYPFHFHHLGWVNGDSYITDSSVYHSFYRCYVMHGTHNLLVKDNTAFHADGHCFYLEDGVEEHNLLEHNAAAFIHVIGRPAGGITQDGTVHVQDASTLEQPADAAAAGFYVPNSNNALINNAASGGWAGFSFPRLDAPIGDFSWMADFKPHQRPLKQFDGNTVHSTAYFFSMAGGIYVGGRLWMSNGRLIYSSGRWVHDTRDEQGRPATMVFTNNKAWLAQWSISHWGDRVRVDSWEAHDCSRGANVFGDASVSNALINGRSANQWSG